MADTPSSRDLERRVDQFQARAKELRARLDDNDERQLAELGIARDRAARAQFAAEQDATSVDM